MTIRITWAALLILMAVLATRLYDTTDLGRIALKFVAVKLGVSAASYVTGVATCPKGYVCTASPTPDPSIQLTHQLTPSQ